MTEEEEILANINTQVASENGMPLLMDDMFMDSELDSLGVSMVLLMLSAEYDIDEKLVETLDQFKLSVKDLVNTCKSSRTST